MRRALFASAIGLALSLSLTGAVEATGGTPSQVDNFRLITSTGHSENLYRYRDAPAVVLVMHAVGSPEIRKLAPALERLSAAYAPKGVKVMMLNSTGKDTRAAVQAEATTLGLTAPILMDENQLAGDQLGADRVSEVFVVDPRTWKVVYQGALGDGKSGAVAALDALLAGKAATVAQIPATGSKINFPNRSDQAKAAAEKIS